MGSQTILAPILPGKLQAWKGFASELGGAKKAAFAEFNQRYGLTRHSAYLQATPDGGQFTIALLEGPGAAEMLPKVARSEVGFDAWFRQNLADIHGFDFTKPPPVGPGELLIDWRG